MVNDPPIVLQIVSSVVGGVTLVCAGLKPIAWGWLQIRTKAMDLQTKQSDHKASQDILSSRGWEQLADQLRTDWKEEKANSLEMLQTLEIRLTTQINDQAAKILKQQTIMTEITENNEELHALILHNQKEAALQIATLVDQLDATSTQLTRSQTQINELRLELEQVHAERDDLFAVFLDISDQLRQAGIEPRRRPLPRDSFS